MAWKLTKKTSRQTVWKNQSKNQMITIAKGDKMWSGFLETLNGDWIRSLVETVAETKKESEAKARKFMMIE